MQSGKSTMKETRDNEKSICGEYRLKAIFFPDFICLFSLYEEIFVFWFPLYSNLQRNIKFGIQGAAGLLLEQSIIYPIKNCLLKNYSPKLPFESCTTLNSEILITPLILISGF